MQAAVVHDGGVGQDPPCKQKRLAFKFASAAWVDATRDVGGGAESKWKEMHPSEQRAGADTPWVPTNLNFSVLIFYKVPKGSFFDWNKNPKNPIQNSTGNSPATKMVD